MQHDPCSRMTCKFVRHAEFACTLRALTIFNYSFLFMSPCTQRTGSFLKARNIYISFSVTQRRACDVTVAHQLWNELSSFNKISLKGKKHVYQPQSNYCPKRLYQFEAVDLHLAAFQNHQGSFQKRSIPGPHVRAIKSESLGVGPGHCYFFESSLSDSNVQLRLSHWFKTQVMYVIFWDWLFRGLQVLKSGTNAFWEVLKPRDQNVDFISSMLCL